MKRKITRLKRLKSQLASQIAALDSATKDDAKGRLANRIIETKMQIEIEKTHRISKYHQIKGYEISSGSPGLGKRK